jgi:hypothetical protein
MKNSHLIEITEDILSPIAEANETYKFFLIFHHKIISIITAFCKFFISLYNLTQPEGLVSGCKRF